MTTRHVLGLFERPSDAAAAARELRERRFGPLEVFTPVPDAGLLEAAGPRPRVVRYFTLVCGLAGLASGFALAIVTSLIYGLIVGGKAPAAPVPYVVIAFELTILFGGLGTLVGLLIAAGLPRRREPPLWDARLSEDRYGVSVACGDLSADQAAELMRGHGAEEVLRG